jgi:hypothetical protein
MDATQTPAVASEGETTVPEPSEAQRLFDAGHAAGRAEAKLDQLLVLVRNLGNAHLALELKVDAANARFDQQQLAPAIPAYRAPVIASVMPTGDDVHESLRVLDVKQDAQTGLLKTTSAGIATITSSSKLQALLYAIGIIVAGYLSRQPVPVAAPTPYLITVPAAPAAPPAALAPAPSSAPALPRATP